MVSFLRDSPTGSFHFSFSPYRTSKRRVGVHQRLPSSNVDTQYNQMNKLATSPMIFAGWFFSCFFLFLFAACWVNAVLVRDDLPELGADLIATPPVKQSGRAVVAKNR